jgi:hypothetical protein
MGASILNLFIARYRLGIIDLVELIDILRSTRGLGGLDEFELSNLMDNASIANLLSHATVDEASDLIHDVSVEVALPDASLIAPFELYLRCCAAPALDQDAMHDRRSEVSEWLETLRSDLDSLGASGAEVNSTRLALESLMSALSEGDSASLRSWMLQREFGAVLESVIGDTLLATSVCWSGAPPIIDEPIVDCWVANSEGKSGGRSYPGVELSDGCTGHIALTFRNELENRTTHIAVFLLGETYWPNASSLTISRVDETRTIGGEPLFGGLVGRALNTASVFLRCGVPERLELDFGTSVLVFGQGYLGHMCTGGSLLAGETEETGCSPDLHFADPA